MRYSIAGKWTDFESVLNSYLKDSGAEVQIRPLWKG